jgi:transcriptional regulator with PAS, ATPase and Fis domain
MERAVVLAEGKPRIEASDLPPEIAGSAPRDVEADGPLALAEVERRHILRVLEKMGGNRKETARALGIGANTLWRKLGQYEALGRRKRQ